MSDPAIGLLMLGLIVAAIMMGFPTAFTLMGMGMIFGFIAFWDPAAPWYDSHIFDLMVQRTYGAMNNDTLISIPLFVFMGYVIERAALVDKMFLSVQLAFRRLPASLAVATLLVCAFWGIASGIVGAVVVLMGVIALRPMLKAGYDIRLASGVITAGGTLGILIPPSVMLIVYAAVAGQSVVKLYAAAMLPGFFLTFLYLVYIIGWALINPKIAPKLPDDQLRLPLPDWISRLQRGPRKQIFGPLVLATLRPGLAKGTLLDGRPVTHGTVVKNLLAALVPFFSTAAMFATVWWYIVIYTVDNDAAPPPPMVIESSEIEGSDRVGIASLDDSTSEASKAETVEAATAPGSLPASTQEELGVGLASSTAAAEPQGPPEGFYEWFAGFAALSFLGLAIYYRRMNGDQLEVLKMLTASVMPLGVLTFIVLAVILLGVTTATESAGIGAIGAMYLAAFEKFRRLTLWSSLVGFAIGASLGMMHPDPMTVAVSGALGGLFLGTAVPWIMDFLREKKLLGTITQSTYLTAKTTAMVCWLFVGSALFSAVFALHGGQQLIEHWVVGLDLSPIEFMILAQLIIFLLGWPLEWTEIIVIFIPIFIPLLAHFNVDPVLFGTMVAVNLQAAFLSPPVAMSAFYLKGVAPKHVTINQIFAGMMPYMLIVLLCLAIMYVWPGMTLWLPNFLYGR
ncbi:MAG: TRAP transporter large permease subunit [Alphaproteobacteria bacterium]|nr:TRAP transporter large permease subunit [Alphaproteobacteria bacterium]